MLKKIARFLHFIDDDGQLDLTDLAFICIMVKIMMASSLDWPSVIVLATACMNKMHRRQSGNKDDEDMTKMIKDQSSQIKDVLDKVNPIIDTIKGKL